MGAKMNELNEQEMEAVAGGLVTEPVELPIGEEPFACIYEIPVDWTVGLVLPLE
jgi:hypothetical protein